MYELSVSESRKVSGGFAPAIVGAIVLGARLAANPAVRSAVIGSARWVGAGFGGAIGAYGGKAFIRKLIKEKEDKKEK